jgi:hypothetical protein
LQSHRDLRAQLEQIHRTLATRLGELETRLERQSPATDVTHRQVEVQEVAPRDRVKA